MEQMSIWSFADPCDSGVFHMVTPSGETVIIKRPPSKGFQAVCDSQYREGWEKYAPSRKERYQPRVCFQASAAAAAAAKSLQSCPTLCDPIDGSPPGSPVPGILQARTLEWVAISFSNA